MFGRGRRGKDQSPQAAEPEEAQEPQPQAPVPDDVPIKDEMIRLGQFLKLANLVESGADAKPVIADGLVQVNGEVETRRGRQLHVGDVVELDARAARVVDEASYSDDLPW